MWILSERTKLGGSLTEPPLLWFTTRAAWSHAMNHRAPHSTVIFERLPEASASNADDLLRADSANPDDQIFDPNAALGEF